MHAEEVGDGLCGLEVMGFSIEATISAGFRSVFLRRQAVSWLRRKVLAHDVGP